MYIEWVEGCVGEHTTTLNRFMYDSVDQYVSV